MWAYYGKLVYDIIPRDQRSNPKGFRLLVKLKFNKAPSYHTFILTIALASYQAIIIIILYSNGKFRSLLASFRIRL